MGEAVAEEEEEEEDSTALEVECQEAWEVVVDEELRKASLVDSLSNDKMPVRRVSETKNPTSTKTSRAIGQEGTALPGTNYRIVISNGLAKWAWASYSQSFSFHWISWRHYWSWVRVYIIASK